MIDIVLPATQSLHLVLLTFSQGDQLDAKIRKAESEVAALEATLLQLMTANTRFNASYKKVSVKRVGMLSAGILKVLRS